MLASVASFLVHYLVVALMFSVGLVARPRDLEQVWQKPRLYLRALLVMEVGVPLRRGNQPRCLPYWTRRLGYDMTTPSA